MVHESSLLLQLVYPASCYLFSTLFYTVLLVLCACLSLLCVILTMSLSFVCIHKVLVVSRKALTYYQHMLFCLLNVLLEMLRFC